ncbi:hypothetical protein, partial [Enterococcus casseliflavus]|uniref:hypothetical protein n=1 Tax=Enterococcus casseliflavus TaxID=37734 RepID=UPI003D14F9BD
QPEPPKGHGHAPPKATPFQPGPAWDAKLETQFKEVRVKVFPHNSSHTTPLGPERTASTVGLQTFGECATFESTGNSSAHAMGAKS